MYPTKYYIALGTNVGNYKNNFSAAISELNKLGEISKIAKIYKSKPYATCIKIIFITVCLSFNQR